MEGEQLLGTIGLWRCDLISRQDLFSWLAALYVAPAARGQGLAGQLQRHVIDYARRAGYQELYLYSLSLIHICHSGLLSICSQIRSTVANSIWFCVAPASTRWNRDVYKRQSLR